VGCAVVNAIASAGGIAIATDVAGSRTDHVLDVTAPDAWALLMAELDRRMGRLDGLVNGAGLAMLGTIEDTKLAQWRHLMAVNLDGSFLGCKYALPLLRRRGGSIVNVASVFGLVGRHNLLAYAASKGGVRMLTKSVALDGARHTPQVRCNCISPAFLEGSMVERIATQTQFPDAARARMIGDVPIGRLGRVAEVADLCTFLLSDESEFVTGAEFLIDGGMTAE
jgi:NAD(P)-dependent dehydrogenase (short-subunit alcohol dehydrogenase family)